MKRIANNVAVETILFCVSGNQHICVIDKENPQKSDGTMVYDGRALDFTHSVGYVKYMRAKVHGIEVSGDHLTFTVCTKYEKY